MMRDAFPVGRNGVIMDQTYLKELFEYNDGLLYWKKPKSNRIKQGDVAGYLGDCYQIRIGNSLYKGHRLTS